MASRCVCNQLLTRCGTVGPEQCSPPTPMWKCCTVLGAAHQRPPVPTRDLGSDLRARNVHHPQHSNPGAAVTAEPAGTLPDAACCGLGQGVGVGRERGGGLTINCCAKGICVKVLPSRPPPVLFRIPAMPPPTTYAAVTVKFNVKLAQQPCLPKWSWSRPPSDDADFPCGRAHHGASTTTER